MRWELESWWNVKTNTKTNNYHCLSRFSTEDRTLSFVIFWQHTFIFSSSSCQGLHSTQSAEQLAWIAWVDFMNEIWTWIWNEMLDPDFYLHSAAVTFPHPRHSANSSSSEIRSDSGTCGPGSGPGNRIWTGTDGLSTGTSNVICQTHIDAKVEAVMLRWGWSLSNFGTGAKTFRCWSRSLKFGFRPHTARLTSGAAVFDVRNKAAQKNLTYAKQMKVVCVWASKVKQHHWLVLRLIKLKQNHLVALKLITAVCFTTLRYC